MVHQSQTPGHLGWGPWEDVAPGLPATPILPEASDSLKFT